MATIGNGTEDTGSTQNCDGNIKCILIPSFPENGTASSISVRLGEEGSGGGNIRGAIYDTSGNLIDYTNAYTTLSGYQVISLTGLTASLTSGTGYVIGVVSDAQCFAFYAASDTYDGRTATCTSAAPPTPDPITLNTASSTDFQLDLIYTPSAGDIVITVPTGPLW